MKKKFLLLFILHINISLVFSQSDPNTTFSGLYNNVPVHSILTDMGRIFNFNLRYCDEECNEVIQTFNLRIRFNKEDKKSALDKLAKYTPFTFQLINNSLVSVLYDKNKEYIKPFSLTGFVTDSSERGLPHAIIKIASFSITSRTNNSGNYKIENLPNDNYIVLYKKSGYYKRIHKVVLNSNTEQNCSLTLNNSLDFLPQGILFETGYGSLSVRDKYISPEKYTGDIQILKLAWSKVHEKKYGYETTFDYVHGAKIRNYGVSAEVQEFTINHIFLFPANREHYLFSKRFYSFIGPSAELWLHVRNQDVSNYKLTLPYSFEGMLSLGFNQKIIVPVSLKFGLSCYYKVGVLSLTGKTNYSNSDVINIPSLKLLTPLTGLNTRINYSVYYNINPHITCQAGYEFRITNIANNALWDDMVNVMDIFSVKFIYNIR
jgi:hypothetical protein